MRTISNFKRCAIAQREAAEFEDPFVEEAIARQGDALTAEIVAWAERTIPKYEEIHSAPPQTFVDSEGNTYSSHYGQPIVSTDQHSFVYFPRAQFQDKWHNEMTLTYH